jgi:hypothetical protein
VTARRHLRKVLLAAVLFSAAGSTLADDWAARFKDEEDGAIDLSNHLLEQRGFLPVPW